MAESFLFGIAQNVLGKLGSLALDEVLLAWGLKFDLQRLQNTLSSIQAVLLDAEEQQANNHQLEDWLGKLKDAIYEIDEVLDEFEIKALQQKVDGGSTSRKVRHFFSRSNQLVFRVKMGHKIKEIRERLDQIADDKNKFGLSVRLVDSPIIHRERKMTYSFVSSDVIGRDKDKENIVKILMSSLDDESFSVIPIVGIGGLGKTTLTTMVYNDERVVEKFELRMWVCVSEEFELEKVIEKIIKSATGVDCRNLDIEQLQIQLRGTLISKKYLLILDDVWNRDRTKWLELRDLLRGGSQGSKIIVTTRDRVVASIMGSSEPYNLEGLSHEECLSLFVKWAFKEGQETQSQRKLMEIGEEIVRKCKGVPLAVRTLGSMLYMKSDEREWVFVRDNSLWELEQQEGGILPALRLSYDQLPSYLKRCFAHCSVFPKDAEIPSVALINLWMALGLIQSPNQNKEVEFEDVGNKYIHELCTISFFQDVVDCGYCIIFKMHDLVHDLALFVAKSEHATIDTNSINQDEEPSKMKNKSISRKVRHVSFCNQTSNSSPSDVPSCLLELDNLRSINFHFQGMGPTSKSFVETCAVRFKCLRLLHLGESSFETLPSSIGRLKHLRYLRLQNNRSIKSLPNSICKLVCLQTLTIYGCEKLEKLPSDIGKLISLRYLSLTTQERCLSAKRIFGSSNCMTSLRCLGILKCSNLESLFDDEDDDDVENGMRHTSTLRTLVIEKCVSLFSLPRGLRYLTALENLVIHDCENLELMFDAHAAEDVVRTGGGLRSLQYLAFWNLPKLVGLPRWLLQGSTCYTLKHIVIANCHNFKTLPDWMTEDLKSLQKLLIKNCPQLKSLPKGMHRLTTLAEIRITKCPELMSRCQRETGEDWHEIAHVPHIYLNNIKI